jgi:hypothetical protein
LTRAKVGYKNQLESLLEQAHIKLSSFVSDLLGLSARRMLKALAEGETDPAALAGLADRRLRATSEQLRDALGACAQLNGVYRRLLKTALEQLEVIETHIEQLDREALIKYRPLELAALRSSRARVFILVAGNLRGSEIAAVFVKALPLIYSILALRSGPFVARITKAGEIAGV